jgi:hypothetical protein
MELLRIYAEDYVSAVVHLHTALDTVRKPDFWSDDLALHMVQSELEELLQNCKKGELPVTEILVNSILRPFIAAQEEPVLRAAVTGDTLAYGILQVDSRLRDEMSTKIYFQLPVNKKSYFDSPRAGWETTLDRFPDCTMDVEEMNRCFALSRYVASIFHALQVAEWGAIALGNYIGVTDPKKGWGPTSKKLAELVKGGHSALPAHLQGRFEFVEQMGQEVSTMALAWRHKIDHAANRLAILPNQEFAPDIAEHIIKSIKMFCTRLVEGLPQS